MRGPSSEHLSFFFLQVRQQPVARARIVLAVRSKDKKAVSDKKAPSDKRSTVGDKLTKDSPSNLPSKEDQNKISAEPSGRDDIPGIDINDGIPRAQAIHRYEAETESELGFEKGD